MSLRDPKITDEAVEHLAKISSLKRLDITGTKITDEGLAQLRDALPKCEIVRKY